MRSIAVYLVQRLYGGPEDGGWYYDAGELCTVPELTAFGTTIPAGHEDRAVRMTAEVQAHLDRDWNVDDHARPLSTRQYARLVAEWGNGIGLRREDYGTHSLRRTKASIIYKASGNLRAVQILFGHAKIENTVRYLGVDVEDA